MGFMTVAILLNDAWDQYEKYPEQLVEGLTRNGPHARERDPFGRSSRVGNYVNPVVTFDSRHADEAQLILAHENGGTRIGYGGARDLDARSLGHYERHVKIAEAQLEWARESIAERKAQLEAAADMETSYSV